MPRGGFGGGFGRGFGMRRVGYPIVTGGMGMGMGSLLTPLLAGGVGYALGSNSAQQSQQPTPYPVAPYAYPYQPPVVTQPSVTTNDLPSSPDKDGGTLAKLQLLGELHTSGVLTDEEFASEKRRLIGS